MEIRRTKKSKREYFKLKNADRILLLALAMAWGCKGQQVSTNDTVTDAREDHTLALAATDGLGRTLPQNKEVGDPLENRQVGLFYFLWQGHPASTTSEHVWDLSKLWEEHPETFEDFDHPNRG